MTKKKQGTSNSELIILKSLGLLVVASWIISIIFTVSLVSQYGLWGAGFIAFYLYLALIPITYLFLCVLVIRLRPKGAWYGAIMFLLVVGLLPLTFFLSAFTTMIIRIDPMLTFILLGIASTSLLYFLHKKATS